MNKSSRLNQSHEFTIYLENLSQLLNPTDSEIVLTNPEVVHRIINVLRMQQGHTIIIFDKTVRVCMQLVALEKKKIVGTVIDTHKNSALKPEIIFLLPLLKREALEEALYGLVELGINTIALVKTEKVQYQWKEKDKARAQAIMIAAAEQSKNYCFSTLLEPIELTQVFDSSLLNGRPRIFFDAMGMSAHKAIDMIQQDDPEGIVLAIGPEADITAAERDLFHKHDFTFCALTPTILRARQAAVLGAGLFRALFR